MNELTHIDLFSGIGGFSLAAEWAGFKTIAFSEINEYASAVLRKHWPGVPNLGDIKAIDGTKLRGASLLTGGFPCQPYSSAGERRGEKDDRALWPEMLRVISESKPHWIVGENVTGFISMDLGRSVSDLEAVQYTVAPPFVIPACAIGADHGRDRVWIIAHSNEKRELQSQRVVQELRRRPGNRFEKDATHTDAARLPRRLQGGEDGEDVAGLSTRNRPAFNLENSLSGEHWDYQPVLGRGLHGVSNRMDRIACLGNAIVPQVAYQILKGIAQIERGASPAPNF